MQKDNGKTGIVFDRDTSEPEAKLVKRKKKKITQPDPNNQINPSNSNTNNNQPSSNKNQSMNSQMISNSNQRQKANEGNINQTQKTNEGNINQTQKTNEGNINQTQKTNEGNINNQLSPIKEVNKKTEDKLSQQKKSEDTLNKDNNKKQNDTNSNNANVNVNINKDNKNEQNSVRSIEKEENKKELNSGNKGNTDINNTNNINNSNNVNTQNENKNQSEKQQYKNNQQSNSLNAFSHNTNYNDPNENQSDNKTNLNSNSNLTSKRLLKQNNNSKDEDKIIETQNKEKELNEMQNRINELLLLKEEYEKHICPSVSFDKEAYLMQIESMKSEIERNNKTIQSLTQTNNRQRKALEELSNQLNQKLEKINFNLIPKSKQSQSQSRLNIEDNPTDRKYQSLESELKLKEKELRNAIALIEILSKDNSQLKTSLDTYGEYPKKLQLIDLAKAKDAEIALLITELNLIKKQIDDHKHCFKHKSDSEANIAMLKEEIKRNKKEMSQLRKKNSELMVGTISHMQHQNLPNIPNQDNEGKIENKSCKEFNTNQPLRKNGRTKSMSPILKQRMNRSKEKPALKNENYFHELFSDEEKMILIRLFKDDEKYEQFIRKIIIIETAKNSIENKYKFIVKQLMDKISSLDEQIEYLNQKNKESESRLKIFQYQVNEYKQGKKVYQKKLNEYQNNTQQLENQIKEQKQEINILTHQLETVKSQKIIFKENCVGNINEKKGCNSEEEGTNDVNDDADANENENGDPDNGDGDSKAGNEEE